MMIRLSELHRARTVPKAETATPLLVPSFSSRGFPYIGHILATMRDQVTDTALVSSYDLHHGHISLNEFAPDLLFVDSGGFEATAGLGEDFGRDRLSCPLEWDRDLHTSVQARLSIPGLLARVSYDEAGNRLEIKRQAELAYELFAPFPGDISVFLVKPYADIYLDAKEVCTHAQDIASFDMLGVTEKELGDSVAARLRTLAEIRTGLSASSVHLPIHVFGCLDPLMIQLFNLCGADVFDGLSWLRFGFHDSLALYANNWAIINGAAELTIGEMYYQLWSSNLHSLKKLQARMRHAAASCNMGLLPIKHGMAREILQTIGISLA